MERFSKSRSRGWRWLFVALGAVFCYAAVHVFLNVPETMALRDAPILIFPALLLASSLALLYFGIFSDEAALQRWVNRIIRWER